MKANKKLAAVCIAAAVLVAAFVGVYVSTRPQTQQGEKTILVEVVHGDQTSKEFTFNTDVEYLGQVLEAEELVVFENGAYGMFITTVDGEQAVYEEDGAYWALYEGEEYATTSAAGIVLTDGGVYKLIYESF